MLLLTDYLSHVLLHAMLSKGLNGKISLNQTLKKVRFKEREKKGT